MGKLLKWSVIKGLEKADELRETNMAKRISKMVGSASEITPTAAEFARLLTLKLETQLDRIAPPGSAQVLLRGYA